MACSTTPVGAHVVRVRGVGGDITKKPEIEKCDMGSSVEEKQSYLSRRPFLLLK